MKSLNQYMEDGDLSKVKEMITNNIEYDVNTCLTTSAYDGFLNLVKYFVSLGADIHHNNNEALLNTTYYRHWEIYHYLLEQGAKLNDNIIKNIAQFSDERMLYDVIEKGYATTLISYASKEKQLIIHHYLEKKKLSNDLSETLEVNEQKESKNKI